MLRSLTGDNQSVQVGGTTVREIIAALEDQYPGIQDKLCSGDEIRPGLAVSVGDVIVSNGLAEIVPQDAEVHFLPALGGG